jgi:hypothetical protein
MIADYNGWADQREEEREGLDQLAHPAPARVRPRLPRVRRELLVRARRAGDPQAGGGTAASGLLSHAIFSCGAPALASRRTGCTHQTRVETSAGMSLGHGRIGTV